MTHEARLWLLRLRGRLLIQWAEALAAGDSYSVHGTNVAYRQISHLRETGHVLPIDQLPGMGLPVPGGKWGAR